jgi:hypothetical protein
MTCEQMLLRFSGHHHHYAVLCSMQYVDGKDQPSACLGHSDIFVWLLGDYCSTSGLAPSKTTPTHFTWIERRRLQPESCRQPPTPVLSVLCSIGGGSGVCQQTTARLRSWSGNGKPISCRQLPCVLEPLTDTVYGNLRRGKWCLLISGRVCQSLEV